MECIPDSIETPSGKNIEYENFPVGSWLLPAHLRPHVAIFYQFARTIDDIADNPNLDPEEKVRRLSGFEAAIIGVDKTTRHYRVAHQIRRSLDEFSIKPNCCLDLIKAFKQDSVKFRYKNWEELMTYCSLSAAPVGRFLLDLHGGSKNGYGPSDALCKILQIINHLQDCQEDYQKLNRVYLPMEWMAEEKVSVKVLSYDYCLPELRRVISRVLDATESLMVEAKRLPAGLSSRRLAMESAVIIKIADKLIQKLRKDDPLTKRVVLRKSEYVSCVCLGTISGLLL